jgi:response regulator RpfG family c-di-GMP phosphodiesterase
MEDSIFADEPQQGTSVTAKLPPWHVLVVDDEAGVHQVTEMVFRGFKFNGRPLKISNAYSAKEGREIIQTSDDIALAIIDVVMETDEAGLDLVRYIRKDLKNHYTRLVLRTGQPGQAPEEHVIINYDVDDYKDKTELTSNKLITLLYATLRSYRDICTIDQHRRSLEQVILSSTEVFEADSLKSFASAVLEQVCILLNLKGAIFYCASLNEDLIEVENYQVLAASGAMSQYQTNTKSELPDHVLKSFETAQQQKHSFVEGDSYTGYFTTSHGSENLLYVTMEGDLSEMDHQLLDIYANNVAITYENLLLNDEIIETQKELAYILGEAVEKRSKETGSHVKRVALFSHLLARLSGISDVDAHVIKLASPLHDVGKIAIPDKILKKPGKFEPEEWEIMKTHAQIGADLLSNSDNEVISMGKIIAAQHHERWEGGGYPNNLKGTEIHIAGRISALADVFDALGSKRCYKEPWSLEDILAEIDQQKGKHFDPSLVDLLNSNIDQFIKIRDQYPE